MRNVDGLVEQLGVHGMCTDRVSALCRGLGDQVLAFGDGPPEGRAPVGVRGALAVLNVQR